MSNSPQSLYQLGRMFIESNKDHAAQGLTLIEQAAEQGYPKAFSYLIFFYQYKIENVGIEKFKTLLQYAEIFDLPSQYYLRQYISKETKQDRKFEKEQSKIGLRSGCPNCYFQHVVCLLHSTDPNEQQRSVRALIRLNKMDVIEAYITCEKYGFKDNSVEKCVLKGEGFFFSDPPNYEKALAHFLEAESNDSLANCYLGIMYYKGLGVSVDVVKAISYFRASLPNEESYINLGHIYMGEKLYHEALLSFKKAYYENYSNSIAQFNIGFLHENGYGTPKNIQKAIKWYKYSSNNQNQFAQLNLGRIYLNQTPPDINKAILFFEKSSQNQNCDASYNLGLIYENGINVNVDINKAISYYSKAAKNGHFQSIQKLSQLK